MYKNWRNISQIKDVHFMWALALLDLTTDFGESIAEQLTFYFDEIQGPVGPIPLSALREKAKLSPHIEDCGDVENNLVFCDAIPKEWPLFYFGNKEAVQAYENCELVPDELSDAEKVGEIYEWKSKKLVLVEHDFVQGEEWFFVPAELIITDK